MIEGCEGPRPQADSKKSQSGDVKECGVDVV
jgi:hypothetical protein